MGKVFKKKAPPRGFKTKSPPKGKKPPKTKLKVTKPPTTPKAQLPPQLHNCAADDSLTFYLIEVKGAKDKTPRFTWEFWSAPRTISSVKKVMLNEPKTQGNTQQPLGYQYTDNRRWTLGEITFDGKSRGVLPKEALQGLEYMQTPGPRSQLRVFELVVKNGQSQTRSYGKFVVMVGTVKELLRDQATGQALRLSFDIELIEVASYQLDFGQDLSIPSTLIPTLPPELLAGTGTGGGGDSTTVPGGTIPAGTLIVTSGNSGRGSGPHLHMIYWPNDNGTAVYNKAAASQFISRSGYGGSRGNRKVYPPEITDIVSIDKKGTKTPLSKTGLVSSPPGPRIPPQTSKGSGSAFHIGQDFGLAFGTDLYSNFPLTFVGRAEDPSGYGTYATFKCVEKGHEGFYMFCHLNNVNAAVTIAVARNAQEATDKATNAAKVKAEESAKNGATKKPAPPKK